MKRSYSWNREIFLKALKFIGRYELKHLKDDMNLVGAFDWFEIAHPEKYREYLLACQEMHSLWDKNDPASQEQFKQLVKQYVDTCAWLITQYISHLKEQEELKKYPQGELALMEA
ncbi:MAG: hypothetical protein Q7U10_08890 [Thermodesulfovibrionia bacterium]|nr:hypothetical protein [Thermodesulfovibrionia bacterium]